MKALVFRRCRVCLGEGKVLVPGRKSPRKCDACKGEGYVRHSGAPASGAH